MIFLLKKQKYTIIANLVYFFDVVKFKIFSFVNLLSILTILADFVNSINFLQAHGLKRVFKLDFFLQFLTETCYPNDPHLWASSLVTFILRIVCSKKCVRVALPPTQHLCLAGNRPIITFFPFMSKMSPIPEVSYQQA